MSCSRSTIFPSKSLVAFILLVSSIINAFPFCLGMEEMQLARIPGTKRAKALYNNHLRKRDGSIITMREGDYYITTIYTNDESVEYDVIVDTGSALTWVGADPKNPYVRGPSGWATNQKLQVVYGRGRFEGWGYIDSITLETQEGSNPLTVNAQFIGQATFVSYFPSLLDGILGLARKEASSMRDRQGNPIPTVFESLYNEGTIKHAAFGVYLIPVNDRGVGEITFGYYNEAAITSGVNYVPITNIPAARNHWSVDASVMYDGRTILNPTAAIVDTACSLIAMQADAVSVYQTATGAAMDSEGWLTISLDQYDNLQTLSIIIGGQSYDLSPNAQIWPRKATYVGPIKLVVAGMSETRWGLGIGHPFIQRYYVVYNATSSQIGFASTRYTGSTTN
ncbi:hypothetical protein ID866_8944 [Astraeus odoratus]|nr:hypothetical protein ID866_8944 [Astraeus odoratus]